jgi:hypothetical protein
MWATQTIPSALHGAPAGRRAGSRIRRAVFLLGTMGIGAGAAVVITAPALASVGGSEPGNLRFNPTSGAIKLTPTWSTTDGCPAGYRGSAQVSVFKPNGTFLSRISNVAYNVTKSFGGELDGDISAIVQFANVSKGGAVDFVVGCYTQVGGTGKVKWIQSTRVTVSSGGTSYTTSSASGQQGESTSGSAAAHQGSGAANVRGVSATNTADSTGMSSAAEASWIAVPCALLAAIAGVVVYRRRRDRSRLM